MGWFRPGRIACALLALSWTTACTDPGDAVPTEATADRERPPTTSDEAWLEVVSERVWQSQYALRRTDHGFAGLNRDQRLRVDLSDDGVAIRHRSGGDDVIVLRTAHTTAASPTTGECAPGGLTGTDGSCLPRVDYADGAITEWWANHPDGIEQGWTIREAPRGAELVLEVEVDGATVRIEDDGQSAWLQGPDDLLLSYSGLAAWDADGRVLLASMEPTASGLAITVDTLGAAFPIVVDPVLTNPAWLLTGTESERLGTSVAGAGDVNGDGWDDLLVGAPQWDYVSGGTYVDAGRVYLYFGSPTGPSLTPDWERSPTKTDARMGESVDGAGDVNGDGFADIIIGAFLYDNGFDNEGRVWVFHGSPTGPGAIAEWFMEGELDNARLGAAVSAAGDVNGDGYGDVVFGAPRMDAPENGEGVAFVVLGSAGGLEATPAWSYDSDQPLAWLGFAVDSAGDVNADGFGDIIVGAPHWDSGAGNEGRAYVFHGSPSGPSRNPDWTFEPANNGAEFGNSVAGLGDVDGDGFGDVAIGAPLHSQGSAEEGFVRVFRGSAAGLDTTVFWNFQPDLDDWRFGASVAAAGDVNADGYADLLVGATMADVDVGGTVHPNNGQIYLFEGGPAGMGTDPVWTRSASTDNAQAGGAVAGAGDVNGDGFADVIGAAPLWGGADNGRVWLHYGRANGPSTVESASIGSGEWAAGNYMTATAVGDVNGDGYDDVLAGFPSYDGAFTNGGIAFLYLGSGAGISLTPDWSFAGQADDNNLAGVVAGLGDIDGDGFADIAVRDGQWVTGLPQAGAALIFRGSPSGPSANPDAFIEDNPQLIAAAGDVNGDGLDDLIVGDSNHTAGSTLGAGRAQLYYGRVIGPAVVPDWEIEGAAFREGLGANFAGPADFNGDGFFDLAITLNQSSDPGSSVAVYYGGSDGPSLVADWQVFNEQASDAFGDDLAAGDLDGDGLDELIIGSRLYDVTDSEGRVQVFAGRTGGLATGAAWDVVGQYLLGRFGSSLTTGDVDGDGIADLIVGSPNWTAPGQGGRIDLFAGSAAGPSTVADWSIVGSWGTAKRGQDLSAADVNGDGFADIVDVGSSYSDTQVNEGQVAVFYGNTPDGAPALHGTGGHARHTLTGERIQPHTRSDRVDSFAVGGTMRSPFGRQRTRVQAEVKPLGVPFDGKGLVDGATWVDTLGSGADSGTVLPGLTEGTAYHWRFRLHFDPTQAPPQSTSHWIYGETAHPQGVHVRTGCAADADGDLLCDAADPDDDNDGSPDTADCEPTNPGVFPGNPEIVGDGIDQNCDGEDGVYCFEDLDADNAGSTVQIVSQDGRCTDEYESDNSNDCDDTDGNTYPGASEDCDGVDNDCANGIPADEIDTDGDGYFECAGDCEPLIASVHPNAAELCDGYDTDCSGTTPTDEADGDSDGVMTCAGDCDDTNAAVFPGAPELCDGVDNDCSGPVTGESDADADGQRVCAGDCDDSRADIYAGAPERCDGDDNDCNGATDEGLDTDDDGDGHFTLDSCALPRDDCDDSRSQVYGGAPELCDGIDNDCDPEIDEGLDFDADNDGHYAIGSCLVAGDDCDDSDPDNFPTNPEVCDGADNDCDNVPDDGLSTDADGDGHYTTGSCALPKDDCDDGNALTFLGAPEICDGEDNNCDSVIPAAEIDTDGDTFSVCEGDCDDGEITAYPGATEQCGNGIDEDCSGADDPCAAPDLDGDGFCGSPVLCSDGTTPGDCDDSAPTKYPGAPELCDGLDNDCSGSPLPTEVDADADGVRVCAGDCNDANATIYPGAPELCDTLDNDCDNQKDEGLDTDADNDGHYTPGSCATPHDDCDDTNPATFPGAAEACDGQDNNCDSTTPANELDGDGDGVSTCQGDCDDGNSDAFPGATEICENTIDEDCNGTDAPCAAPDLDGDGYCGSPVLCSDGSTPGDCNDDDASTYPGATELCDGLDNDCSGSPGADEVDSDADGFRQCGGDCDDTTALTYPGAPELCDNADNDCDNVKDDGLSTDADSDGHYAPGSCKAPADDCADNDATTYPGALEICDGIDNDCLDDLPAAEQDSDSDGVMTCEGDCDDDDASAYPGATEVCENTIDEDCNGTDAPCASPDVDGDGFCGSPTTCSDGSTPGDCNDDDATIYPGAPELCDGLTNNCSGTLPANESDADGDGESTCAGDCNDSNAAVNSTASEVCDGLDNDCANGIDDGLSFDVDADGHYGVGSCAAPADDCDDTDPNTYGGATELCDGVDNDCDRSLPAAENDLDADGVRVCAGDCDDGNATAYPGAPELCENAIDEDCNGTDAPCASPDVDGDGYCGSPTTCSDGSTPGDCDDDDATVYPGATERCDGLDNNCDGAIPADEIDADSDGESICEGDCNDTKPAVHSTATEICDGLDNDCKNGIDDGLSADGDSDGHYALGSCALPNDDCDDTNPDRVPGATETCDGIDNNCDGLIPASEIDDDSDGYSECEGDCNDATAGQSPGRTDVCGNGLDEDCSGADAPCGAADVDGDGFCGSPVSCTDSTTPGDCNDADPTIFPGATELCDGIDNDCNPSTGTNETDADADGWRICDGDCRDTNPSVNPGATEVCGNGVDDDCDSGDVLCGSPDGDGDGYCDDTECSDGSLPGDCDDDDDKSYPGATELCDGIDNDCADGVPADELDVDLDGFGLCDGDCDDDDEGVYPGAPEICENGTDEDCNGQDDPCVGTDADGDGFCDSPTACGDDATPGDCDDADATVYPGAVELCDGIDNSCDGVVPANETDGDGDGWVECDGDCDDLDAALHPDATEVCDGVDNDCDGETDPDCGDEDDEGGCGCASAGPWGFAPVWLGAIGLLGLRRRRPER